MISVALATYNGSRYIERQLESIKNQSLAVDEVVICDDCSTDNTVNLCEVFIKDNNLLNWKIFVNGENKGFCLNFYNAIEKCSGDYIFLCDQDDEWLPNKVKDMVAVMESNSEILTLSSRYDVIDEFDNTVKSRKIRFLTDDFDGSLSFLKFGDFIGCSFIRGFSICFRKSLKQYIREIDLKDLLAHDWFICILGCLFGKTAVLNSNLTHYRYHKDNVSLAYIKDNKRNVQKRLSGLYQSVEGHKYINSLLKDRNRKIELESFINFEERRIKFLETKNILIYISLFNDIKQYNRYYKGNGLRVFIGDFLYIFKKRRLPS